MLKQLIFLKLFMLLCAAPVLECMKNENIIDDESDFKNENIIYDSYESDDAAQTLEAMDIKVPPGLDATTILAALNSGMSLDDIMGTIRNNEVDKPSGSSDYHFNSYDLPNQVRLPNFRTTLVTEEDLDCFIEKFKSIRNGFFRVYGNAWKCPIGSADNFKSLDRTLMRYVSDTLKDVHQNCKPFPIVPTEALCCEYKKFLSLLQQYQDAQEGFFEKNFYDFAQCNFEIFKLQAEAVKNVLLGLAPIPDLKTDVKNTLTLIDLMLNVALVRYDIQKLGDYERLLDPAAYLADTVVQSAQALLSIFSRHNEFTQREHDFVKAKLDCFIQPFVDKNSIMHTMNIENLIIDFLAALKKMAQDYFENESSFEDVHKQFRSNNNNDVSDCEKKNEFIDDDQIIIDYDNSIEAKFKRQGFTTVTMNYFRNSGYDINTMINLLENGFKINEILGDYDYDPAYPSDEYSGGYFVPAESHTENASSIIIIQENKSSKNDDKKKLCRTSAFLDEDFSLPESGVINEVFEFSEKLNSCIMQCKEYKKNVIKGLENTQFKSQDIIDFFKFSEKEAYCMLDKSGILCDKLLQYFGLDIIQLVISFYCKEVEIIQRYLKKIEQKISLEKVLYKEEFSENDHAFFKEIMIDLVNETFGNFLNELNSYKRNVSNFHVQDLPSYNIYNQFGNLFSNIIQARFEFAQTLATYGPPGASDAACKQIGSLNRGLKWVVKNALAHTFENPAAQEDCLLTLKKKIAEFRSQQHSIDELENSKLLFKHDISEIIQEWLGLQASLNLVHEFE